MLTSDSKTKEKNFLVITILLKFELKKDLNHFLELS